MAQHNLRWAAEAVQRHPEKARALGVDSHEVASWREAAEKMLFPNDERLGVTPQDETFTEHAVWDFAHTAPDQYPLLLHFPYFDLYRKQVVKQADLVLAMHLRGDAFTPEQKARNFAYYEPLTVRDSSLSASTQAVLAAEVGQLQLAYDYLGEAALIDLYDLHHNVQVAGLGGMRVQNGSLTFAPRLPDALGRLAFHLLFRGCRLRVEVRATEATYRLLDGSPLAVRHHGEEILLPVDEAVTRPIPDIQAGPRPTQPPGREVAARGVRGPQGR
jgi:alpha,alpha-trehalose phosphorylase